MRTAIYDLSTALVTWDFVTWAVNIRDLGYQKINFQTKTIPPYGRKWLTPQEILHRVDNFMLPSVQTLGLSYGFDPVGDRNVGSSHYYHMRPNFLRFTVDAEFHGRPTVTLREVPYKQHRNSHRGIWLEFARRIDAVVIDEYAHKRISFNDRFKLYAGASMNYGVTNGPLAAAFLTPYPITMFCADRIDRKGMSGHHILPGGQIQFSLPNQNLVWGEITLEHLLETHERLQLDDRNPGVGATCRCALAGDFASYWRGA
jgi:hypothetical protein